VPTFWKHQQGLATIDRHQRKADRKKRLNDAYEAVDKRDEGVCWVTGRKTHPSGGPETARDHHHLAGRNVRPEWKFEPDRIITVCREAHRLITDGIIEVEGDDARLPIFFHWAEWATDKHKILIIKRRNVSKAGVEEQG
jgi:hypothetical protein